MEKIKIGISTCLLGEKVRYDGGHKLERYITDTLGQYFEWVPVIDEGRLHDPNLRENFIERVFVYKRWKEFLEI